MKTYVYKLIPLTGYQRDEVEMDKYGNVGYRLVTVSGNVAYLMKENNQ